MSDEAAGRLAAPALGERCRTLGCADLTDFQCGMLAAAEGARRMLSGGLGIASAEGELRGIVHSAPLRNAWEAMARGTA